MKCSICGIYNAKGWLKNKPVCSKCYKLFKISDRNRYNLPQAWFVRRRLSGYDGN